MLCQNHADRDAVAMCINCRNFFCAECKTVIDGKNYCFSCVEKMQPAVVAGTEPLNSLSNDPDPAPTPPPAKPTVIPPVPVKKKSGCLKWAIIAIIIALFLAIVLAVAGILVYRKVIAPKLQPQTEQQFAESTTAEPINPENSETPAIVGTDTTLQPSAPMETEPAPNNESSSETPTPTSAGSTTTSPESPPALSPMIPPPGIVGQLGPVPVVDSAKLLSYLPTPLAIWRAGDTKSGKFQRNNYTYTSAQREYYFPPQNCKVTITIYDYGRNPQMYGKFQRPAVYSNANGYQKLVDIQGQRGIEKMDTKTKSGELSIEVARRYVVEVQGDNIPNTEVLKVYTEGIDLTQLAQLQ